MMMMYVPKQVCRCLFMPVLLDRPEASTMALATESRIQQNKRRNNTESADQLELPCPSPPVASRGPIGPRDGRRRARRCSYITCHVPSSSTRGMADHGRPTTAASLPLSCNQAPVPSYPGAIFAPRRLQVGQARPTAGSIGQTVSRAGRSHANQRPPLQEPAYARPISARLLFPNRPI